MDVILKMIVLTILVLIFALFYVSPLQAAINESIENDARLQAQRIASSINIISTAPDGTEYTITLPSKCKIEMAQSFVKFTTIPSFGSEISNTVSLIATDAIIANKEFQCNRALLLKRIKTATQNEIQVIP